MTPRPKSTSPVLPVTVPEQLEDTEESLSQKKCSGIKLPRSTTDSNVAVISYPQSGRYGGCKTGSMVPTTAVYYVPAPPISTANLQQLPQHLQQQLPQQIPLQQVVQQMQQLSTQEFPKQLPQLSQQLPQHVVHEFPHQTSQLLPQREPVNQMVFSQPLSAVQQPMQPAQQLSVPQQQYVQYYSASVSAPSNGGEFSSAAGATTAMTTPSYTQPQYYQQPLPYQPPISTQPQQPVYFYGAPAAPLPAQLMSAPYPTTVSQPFQPIEVQIPQERLDYRPQTLVPVSQFQVSNGVEMNYSPPPVQYSTYCQAGVQAPGVGAPLVQSAMFYPMAYTAPPSTQQCNPLMNSANMEVVWHSLFDQLFRDFPLSRWSLAPTDELLSADEFVLYNDSAKVRFLCQNCCNAWTSMKGRVMFWFKLDAGNQRGFVQFKLFGQKCQKCLPKEFEHAMWYPEEVEKVLTNLFQRVGQAYYGFPQLAVLSNRRPGRPRTQHNATLCQACTDGICREGAATRA